MKKVLEIGRTGALLIVCDTKSKFEAVSCWGYDKKSESWSQGHYFTEWYNNITEESKLKCIERARKHFEKNYK